MSKTHEVLAGSERPLAAGAQRVRDVDPNAPVRVTVRLKIPQLPTPDKLPAKALSPAEFARKYGSVKRTTVLTFDTATSTGSIKMCRSSSHGPDAVSMRSTCWIQELVDTTVGGHPKLRMQYLQVVILEFAPRTDGIPGLIGWPHVSINTLEKVACVVQAFHAGLTG